MLLVNISCVKPIGNSLTESGDARFSPAMLLGCCKPHIIITLGQISVYMQTGNIFI